MPTYGIFHNIWAAASDISVWNPPILLYFVYSVGLFEKSTIPYSFKNPLVFAETMVFYVYFTCYIMYILRSPRYDELFKLVPAYNFHLCINTPYQKIGLHFYKAWLSNNSCPEQELWWMNTQITQVWNDLLTRCFQRGELGRGLTDSFQVAIALTASSFCCWCPCAVAIATHQVTYLFVCRFFFKTIQNRYPKLKVKCTHIKQ